MQIPLYFAPRWYQRDGLTALDSGARLVVWCWARRGGKDFTAFCYAIKKMVEKPINVVIVWPTKKQGYDNFWTAIDNDGRKVLDQIPSSIVANQTNSPTDMRIIFKNGSSLTLLGATDPDALRGANAKLYIFSEFVDIDSAVYEVIRPVVAVNGGQIIIQSTPKVDGVSGGTFKIMFDRAMRLMKAGDRTQFASLITADEYLTPEILEDLRQEAISKYGNDFFWRQEYMCDWGQSSSTSYYGAIIQAIQGRQQIGRFPYDPAHPAYTAWDLGTSDSTAITMFQYHNMRPKIIDYYETHDIGYAPIVNFLATKPYNFAWHFIPHDGAVRDQSDVIQRIYKLQELGLPNSSLLQRTNKEDGINRAVTALSNTDINEATTEELRRKLLLYKRKFNPFTGDYEGPEHKTESHAADSVRYMFDAIEQTFDERTGLFLFSDSMMQDSYESDLITVPSF